MSNDEHAEYERQESVCRAVALSQWERSLKRPDLDERSRVIGAIEAYKRQAFVFNVMLDQADENRSAVELTPNHTGD